ncbi:hypothetical protein GOZ81_10360 [Agrobacterium vitis]|uniref:hypothetical protein n=1 Tax=Agrobacterium vitis TaxID=373 RepID=UPI0012E82FC3|nr:hypothetical protein [Agrobacterium vitis]MVA71477.1 hypothetical protein [Agrobacterium vitis]
MKRVNLLDYFELAESLMSAKSGLSVSSSTKAASIYFAIAGLIPRLDTFLSDDNGFSTSKHAASDLLTAVTEWVDENAFPGGQFSTEKFERELETWEWGSLKKKVESFRTVFEAECHGVDVYSVGQISIYKTQTLVSNGAKIIPEEYHKELPAEALGEFDNAGKCLAFDLPTSCGFHALRGLELVMDAYLVAFGVNTKRLRSWNMYIQAAKKLIDDDRAPCKPSPKVAAMLDRMRELDRNPLMHPRDTLDTLSADQLYKLCAITVGEIVRDIRKINSGGVVAKIANDSGALLPAPQLGK